MKRFIVILLVMLWACPAIAQDGICKFVYAYGEFGSLLGAWDGEAWLDRFEAAALVPGGEEYRVYQENELVLRSKAGAPNDLGFALQYPLDPAGPFEPAIGASCAWDPVPLPQKPANDNGDNYKDITARLLDEAGLPGADVRIRQVVHADIDGDGVAEVLVNALRLKNDVLDLRADAGDYAMVYVLRKVGRRLIAAPLKVSVHPKDDETVLSSSYKILAVLDLSGDGMLEVVLSTSEYEFETVEVFQQIGGTMKPVLNTRLDPF